MQSPAGLGDTKRVVARFLVTVSLIIEQQERRREEYLLRFASRDFMTLALASVTRVPVELDDFR